MNNEELNLLYSTSCDQILPYLIVEGQSHPDTNTPEAKAALNQGIIGLKKILEHKIEEDNWSAYWFLGKAYQSLKSHQESYTAFLTAYKIAMKEDLPPELNSNLAAVIRELAFECLYIKKFPDAVYYCRTAIEFDSEDYTLWTNIALAYLFNKQVDLSEDWVNKTLSKLPNDLPSQNIKKIIADVKAGNRPIPDDFEKLEEE